jgi:flagellar FliL protein
MTQDTSGNPGQKEKKASPILGILRVVAIVLAIIVFLSTVLTNVMLVYVIFAPDDMPKPFYLMYYNAGETPPALAKSGTTSIDGQKVEAPVQGAHVPAGQNPAAESTAGSGTGITPGQGILLDTGTKIVNLAEPGGRKFIRTNVVLEFAPTDPVYFTIETPSATSGESTTASPRTAFITKYKDDLNSRLPVINDIIITLLSTKDFQAVYTSEGKENLRQEIMQAVNSRLPEFKVIYVYFTEFVMQ